jgi:hypothetical protein
MVAALVTTRVVATRNFLPVCAFTNAAPSDKNHSLNRASASPSRLPYSRWSNRFRAKALPEAVLR